MKKNQPELTPSGSEEKKNMKLVGRRILIGFAAVLLVLVIAVFAVVKYYMGKIERVGEDEYTMSAEQIQAMEEELRQQQAEDSSIAAAQQTTAPEQTTLPPETTQAPTEAPTEETAAPTDGTEPAETYELVNILLIGQDKRPEEDYRTRSDAMILVTLNRNTNTVILTSFMRDLYVEIPGHEPNLLNTAYPIGGMRLLDQTLYDNFGVEVDANIEVDFSGFESIINAIGGVDVELDKYEINYLQKRFNYNDLVEGVNTLDGTLALHYSRIRYIDSDFQRTGRQRKVLSAMIEKLRDSSLFEMLTLLDTVLPLVRTDMTDGEILDYVLDFFPMLADCAIQTQRVPADDAFEYAKERDMNVIKFFPIRTKNMLEETVYK